MKIEAAGGEAPRLYGRHFDHTDLLVSKVKYCLSVIVVILGISLFIR